LLNSSALLNLFFGFEVSQIFIIMWSYLVIAENQNVTNKCFFRLFVIVKKV